MRLALLAMLALAVPVYADDVPADIAALMAKAAKGGTLTDEEMTKVIEYQRGQSKRNLDQQRAKFAPPTQAKPAGPPADVPRFGDVDDAVPTLEARLDVSKRTKLDAKAYQVLVAKIAAKDREFLGDDRADAIKKAADKEPLILAAALSTAGDGAGTLYAATLAAAAKPDDVYAANALGVALQAANIYDRSWDVLVYAETLAKHDDATLESNLGYAAMYLGDRIRASAKFVHALQLDPSRSEPHLGLGLLAKAQGDLKVAHLEFRSAVARGSSEVATQMVDEVAIQSEPTSGNSDPMRAERTPIGDDTGFKAGGMLVIDRKAQHGMVFPMWTPPADPDGVAAFASVLSSWIIAHNNDVNKLHAQRMKARDAANEAIAHYLQAHSKDGITIPLFDTRVITLLDEYNVIYQARVREALRPFNEARMKAIKDAMSLAMSKKCEERGTIVRQLNSSLGGAYAPAATKVKAAVEQYFRATDPYIDSIWQPDLQQAMQLQRRELLANALIGLRTGMNEWSGSLATLGCAGEMPQPNSKSDPVAEAKVKEPTPGKCPIPKGSHKWGIVSMKWSCEGITIEGGAGLFGGIDIKFKGPSGHLEQTVFIGVGAKADFAKDDDGNVPIKGLEAKDGKDNITIKGEAKAIISITKAGGHVVDFGAEYKVSGKVEVKGQSIEAGYGVSASWRAGPNISAIGKANLFGTEYTGWKL
jgi:Flp pilus assembly protein TadD